MKSFTQLQLTEMIQNTSKRQQPQTSWREILRRQSLCQPMLLKSAKWITQVMAATTKKMKKTSMFAAHETRGSRCVLTTL
jgi:hypothetical protein